MSNFTDVKDNICEICGNQATAGIIDSKNKVRYTCQDHAMKLFERIASEVKQQK
jgi:hypothetical protein